MPVSSPSYFGPQRSDGSIVGQTAGVSSTGDRAFLAGQSSGNGSTVADLVIIGDHAGVGPLTNAAFAESILIGSNAGRALTTPTGSAGNDPGVTVIGGYALAATQFANNAVIIGQRILEQFVGNSASPGLSQAIVIGNSIGSGVTTASNQWASIVLIGDGIMASSNASAINSVVVGSRAAASSTTLNRAVFVGTDTGPSVTGASNTLLGFSAGTGLTSGSGNVLVGDDTDVANSGAQNIALGLTATVTGSGASRNVVIGALASTQGGSSGVYLGAGAGNPGTNADHQAVIETNISGTHRACFFADMNAGNIVLGKSTNATDRDTGGVGATNIVKIVNGTIGATNPVGGGYFYVNAGALHWVGSAGTDTAIAPA